MIHLRADGPVSRASIRRWLTEQVPGVTKENAETLTDDFLAHALQAGLIRVYDDMPEVYEVTKHRSANGAKSCGTGRVWSA